MVKNIRKLNNSTSITSNTGYRGIRYRKDINKFTAYLMFRSPITGKKPRQLVIGNYVNRLEAIISREEFITKLY